MNKRPYIYLPILFALVLIAGIVLGTFLIPAISSKNGIFSVNIRNYDKINDVLGYIEEQYVDSTSREGLEEIAINGLLQKLDPHSVYIPAEEFNEANDPLKGNFEGIGVQFRIIRDSITVISVIKGGPSEAEGLLGGDRIVSINGKRVAGIKITNEDVMKQLKGPSGTRVNIGLYRKTSHQTLNKTLVRGSIPTTSVDFAYLVKPGLAYVKVSRFSGNTAEEFVQAVAGLQRKGMDRLILDLRGNGGGMMDAAISMADEFLPDKKLIVYTEGYHRKKQSFYATGDGRLENTKLVILIDEFSASASEILAGAIQDNDRGLIVGKRSFGKGLVQEQIQLPDKSAIRLTVARYHTPTGRCIQKPYTDDYEKYYADFYKQFLMDEEYQDSLNFADTSKRYLTPGGKVVYGGGGIMPDYYVYTKTEFSSEYYKSILYKGIFIDFGFDYADRNRLSLLKYGDAETFIRDYSPDASALEQLYAYAEKQGIRRIPEDIRKSEVLIRAELKGQIGRVLFGDAAYYPVVLPLDPTFVKGESVIR
jgi:carboxyl-terminal processing protease